MMDRYGVGVRGVRGRRGGIVAKGHERTFWYDRSILHVGYDSGFMDGYIGQNLSNCILKMDGLYWL